MSVSAQEIGRLETQGLEDVINNAKTITDLSGTLDVGFQASLRETINTTLTSGFKKYADASNQAANALK